MLVVEKKMLLLPRAPLLWALWRFFRPLPQQVHALRLVPLETILMDVSRSLITFPRCHRQRCPTGMTVSSSGSIPSCGRGWVRSHCWVQAWLESFGFWGQLPSSCSTWTRSAGTCAAPSPSGHAWPEGHNRFKTCDMGDLKASEKPFQVENPFLKVGTSHQVCPTACNDCCTLLQVSQKQDQGWLDTDRIYFLSPGCLWAMKVKKASALPAPSSSAGKPHAPKHPWIHHEQSFMVLHCGIGSEGILGIFLHLSVSFFNLL